MVFSQQLMLVQFHTCSAFKGMTHSRAQLILAAHILSPLTHTTLGYIPIGSFLDKSDLPIDSLRAQNQTIAKRLIEEAELNERFFKRTDGQLDCLTDMQVHVYISIPTSLY